MLAFGPGSYFIGAQCGHYRTVATRARLEKLLHWSCSPYGWALWPSLLSRPCIISFIATPKALITNASSPSWPRAICFWVARSGHRRVVIRSNVSFHHCAMAGFRPLLTSVLLPPEHRQADRFPLWLWAESGVERLLASAFGLPVNCYSLNGVVNFERGR